MFNKMLTKILIIAFISCLGAIALPTEAKAIKPVTYEGLLKSPVGGVWFYEKITYYPMDLFGNFWYYKYDGIDLLGYSVNGYGFYKGKLPGPTGKISLSLTLGFEFKLAPGDNLQIIASTDAKCDIYELVSGRLLLRDFDVVGNNSYQSVPVIPSNTPYLIQFKVDGQVVAVQHFIFNNINYLSTGGNNE